MIRTFLGPRSLMWSSACTKSWLSWKLLADEALGLTLVRRDDERLRLGPEPQRLAFGVERRLQPRRFSSRIASA